MIHGEILSVLDHRLSVSLPFLFLQLEMCFVVDTVNMGVSIVLGIYDPHTKQSRRIMKVFPRWNVLKPFPLSNRKQMPTGCFGSWKWEESFRNWVFPS